MESGPTVLGASWGEHAQFDLEVMVSDILCVPPHLLTTLCSVGVHQGQAILLALGPIAHVKVILAQDHHDVLALRTPNNGKEHVSGSVVTSKASFVHARTAVNRQHHDFFFHCS